MVKKLSEVPIMKATHMNMEWELLKSWVETQDF